MCTSEFEARTAAYLAQNAMLQKGDTVIVALSGGADSMALFRFFLSWRERLGVVLYAAHVNHGLRGADADADAAFVRRQCAAHGVALEETRLAPPQRAGEEWGREQRYLFFAQLARRYGAKVATAHTASDNAETVLFRLARGASVRGAAGIPPVRGVYIRPLLWAQRAQIEAYLAAYGVPYVTDATNETDVYARNKIRHAALPALERAHPGAAQNLARFAAEMAELAAFLDAQADALLAEALLPRDAYLPPGAPPLYRAAILAAAAPPVRRAALSKLITRAAREKTSLVAQADAVLCKGTGAVQLSETLVFRVTQGRAAVEAAPRGASGMGSSWTCPLLPGRYGTPVGITLTICIRNYEKNVNYGKDTGNPLKFCADYDRIHKDAAFRTRKAGDRFRPAGRKVEKPFKKWLSEQRVPCAVRGLLPVLAVDDIILWAPGFGFAEGVMPAQDTKTALTIEVQKTEEIV